MFYYKIMFVHNDQHNYYNLLALNMACAVKGVTTISVLRLCESFDCALNSALFTACVYQ